MKKLNHCVIFLFTFFFIQKASAQQNVGIGTATPNASALLDVNSTTKGILVPRMTSVQRTAITTPATALMVFDTDSACFVYYDGTTWLFMKGKTDNANNWGLTGNAGINPSN